MPRSDAALDVYDDDLKFTQDQIDDARCLIVYEYSEMVQERRAPVYGSLADAIRMAASELSAMRMLSAALAELAVPDAIAFVARVRGSA